MAKAIACDHLNPGCVFTANAPDEEDLLKQVADHAREVHGVHEITPELLAKVRSVIVNR